MVDEKLWVQQNSCPSLTVVIVTAKVQYSFQMQNLSKYTLTWQKVGRNFESNLRLSFRFINIPSFIGAVSSKGVTGLDLLQEKSFHLIYLNFDFAGHDSCDFFDACGPN